MTVAAAPIFLAGDLGGTKTSLRLFARTNGQDHIVYEATLASRDFGDFTSLVQQFLRGAPPEERRALQRACFAVAGPVAPIGTKQTSQITNLGWMLDSHALAVALQLDHVALINDFVAVGYGVTELAPSALAVLQPGQLDATGPCMVLGAGTGLGVCQIVTDANGRRSVIASEGGHVDFAPNSELEMEFLRYMWRTLEHVSYDRILSGSGLVALFTFLAERVQRRHDTALQIMFDEKPGAAAISAAYDSEPLARDAVDWFIRIYGAQAGNLALVNLAYGGVYIAGGIAPKLLARIQAGGFMRAFCNKGRMRPLLERMRVNVVLDTHVGLLGAQARARSDI